jgi:hypothetical protein
MVACLLGLHDSIGQTPNLKPTFGVVELKSGFLPDPYVKEVIAGGEKKTNLGGVQAWVADRPDVTLIYTAGKFPLTFYVDCPEDTTLLIRLPDGTWLADDDSGGNLNPLIKINNPRSGRYDIWVGTFQEKRLPRAKLYITELK